MDLPLLEDDLDAVGVIEPAEVTPAIDIPRCLVLCFFSEVIEQLAARDDAVLVASRRWAHGPHHVYEIRIAVSVWPSCTPGSARLCRSGSSRS